MCNVLSVDMIARIHHLVSWHSNARLVLHSCDKIWRTPTWNHACTVYKYVITYTHKMSVLGLQLSNAFYTRAGNLGPKRTCVVVTYSIGCRVWPHARTTHHSSPLTKCWSIYVSLFERVNRIHKRPTCRFHPFVWIHCYLTVYYPAQYISIDVFVLSKNCDHLYPAMYV